MADSVVAMTTTGTVAGFRSNGVSVWRSIPYALPPVGPLRLRSPRPHPGWDGVRDCTQFGSCAPQNPKGTILGLGKRQPMDEDCLTLNVVSPHHAGRELPVLLFIHGGGPIGSSATPLYNGAALARQGCVFVSVNYRIGALGALDLSPLSSPEISFDSNLYLRDMVMALEWVRDNIASFGGDPARVTIIGESAGGHAVVALMAVPKAEGLFARAIAQSPFLGMIRNPETSRRLAERFASLLGQQTAGIATVLRRADPHDLVAALEQLTAEILANNPGDMSMIGATIDGDLLPWDPFDAIEQGHAHRVPFIVGHTADEANVFDRFVKVLPTTASAVERALAEMDPAQRREIYRSYPNYPDAAACVLLCGDMCFGTAAWRLAEGHARHAPTFLYRYDFAPRTLRWLGLRATHGSDLLPLFDIYRTRIGAVLTVLGHRRLAHRVTDNMQSRWLTFGQTGSPGPDWPLYNDVEHPVFILDAHSRVEFDPHRKRRESWEGFRIPR